MSVYFPKIFMYVVNMYNTNTKKLTQMIQLNYIAYSNWTELNLI